MVNYFRVSTSFFSRSLFQGYVDTDMSDAKDPSYKPHDSDVSETSGSTLSGKYSEISFTKQIAAKLRRANLVV